MEAMAKNVLDVDCPDRTIGALVGPRAVHQPPARRAVLFPAMIDTRGANIMRDGQLADPDPWLRRLMCQERHAIVWPGDHGVVSDVVGCDN